MLRELLLLNKGFQCFAIVIQQCFVSALLALISTPLSNYPSHLPIRIIHKCFILAFLFKR